MKTCSTCKEEKPFSGFYRRYKGSKDGYMGQCKECRKPVQRKYYHKLISTEKGRERSQKSSLKQYRKLRSTKKDREIYREAARKYYHKSMSTEEGRERRRAIARKTARKRLKNGKTVEYLNKRYRNDSVYAIKCRLRARINQALQGRSKSASTAELTGCTWKELIHHIEKQFTNGMSWENRHLWHVDHILPCASFDLSKPEEQRKCFHYTNLQPLWAKENLSKGSKILTSI